MSLHEERRPPNEGAAPKSSATTTSHSLQLAALVSASPEVLEHHDALHRARCPGGGAVTVACMHETTVVVACTYCGEAVFAAVAPGVAACRHADEVHRGLRPSGVWTEVQR